MIRGLCWASYVSSLRLADLLDREIADEVLCTATPLLKTKQKMACQDCQKLKKKPHCFLCYMVSSLVQGPC